MKQILGINNPIGFGYILYPNYKFSLLCLCIYKQKIVVQLETTKTNVETF